MARRAKFVNPEAYIWARIPGRSERYRNTITGDVISRRQFDRKFGRLAERGFRSYEKQAKASPPERRKARPARGRYKESISPSRAKYAQPKPGRLGRKYRFPVNVYKGALLADFVFQWAPYRPDYDDFVKSAQQNPKVIGLAALVSFRSESGEKSGPGGKPLPRSGEIMVIRIHSKESMPGFDTFVMECWEALTSIRAEIFEMIFHVRFGENFIPPSPQKVKPLKVRKKKG